MLVQRALKGVKVGRHVDVDFVEVAGPQQADRLSLAENMYALSESNRRGLIDSRHSFDPKNT